MTNPHDAYVTALLAGLGASFVLGVVVQGIRGKLRAPVVLQRRGDWSRENYPAVYARDRWTCRYCGAQECLSIDHVIPRCQDGDDSLENLVVACWPCNKRKGGRTPEQAGMWLRPPPPTREVPA